MIRKILKAKLTKENKLNIDLDELEQGEEVSTDEVGRKCGRIAHPDAIQAFNALRIHLAALCEQAEFTEFEDDAEKLDKFHVDQITISGEGEHEGVTISGIKDLKEGGVLLLNSRFTKFDPNHCHHYSYSGSLHEAVLKLLNEIDLYLNGKKAPSNQLDFNFDSIESIEATVAPKNTKQIKAGRAIKMHPIEKIAATN